jgi:hypothetical protein
VVKHRRETIVFTSLSTFKEEKSELLWKTILLDYLNKIEKGNKVWKVQFLFHPDIPWKSIQKARR